VNDMSSTIVAKSDQINAADLIGNPRTIVIREVRIKAGDDQPVSVLIEGDNKAFRPCKGVRRLMVRVWGADASKYVGQAMTLFCDPSVTWAGKEEGGIRVSHMSGMSAKIVEYMRTSRAATKPYEILPLKAEKPRKTADEWATDHIALVTGAGSLDRLAQVQVSGKAAMDKLGSGPVFDRVKAAYAKRFAELSATDSDDPFEPQTGRADSDHGDQHDGTDDDPANGRIEAISGEGGK
jgi:hypothetical protein